MKNSFKATALIASVVLANSAIAAPIVVTQFQADGGPHTLDAWYASDIAAGGTASIQNLTGLGGNLESGQPLPTGAARLTTGNSNADKAVVSTYANFGSAASVLSSINLSYSYFKSTTTELAAAPALKLIISAPGGTGDNFGSLIYEPYWNGANPAQGSWQSVSIDQNTGAGVDGFGGWWWNGGFEISNGAGGPPLRSLAEWLAAFQLSDATDFANASVVGISVGIGSYNVNQDDYFDAVSIQTGAIDKTYNFEAGSVPDGGATLVMLGMGMVGMVGFARRKKA